jgi:error-prone DNA polymerase
VTDDAGGPPWAELHCHSSYSFLDGAATPEELVTEAARLGLEALALTDHDGMYGAPQFAQAAAGQGSRIRTVFGAELTLEREGRHLLVLVRDPEGYRRLCATISTAQLAGGEKQRPRYDIEALANAHDGHWVILTGCRQGMVNVICPPPVWERHRRIATASPALLIRGRIERGDGSGNAVNLVAAAMRPLPVTAVLPSSDFR